MLFEKTWLRRFQDLLPSGGSILDAGCGTAEPIARYFIEQGFALTGVDFSQAMIDIARTRFPDHHWHVAAMQDMDLGATSDGIIGWHSFFHLTPEQQRKALANFAKHLAPGGALMLAAGPEAGEVPGQVSRTPVYHASLSPEEYRRRFQAAGFSRVGLGLNDPACGEHSLCLAVR